MTCIWYSQPIRIHVHTSKKIKSLLQLYSSFRGDLFVVVGKEWCIIRLDLTAVVTKVQQIFVLLPSRGFVIMNFQRKKFFVGLLWRSRWVHRDGAHLLSFRCFFFFYQNHWKTVDLVNKCSISVWVVLTQPSCSDSLSTYLILRPKQNRHHLAYDTSKCMF